MVFIAICVVGVMLALLAAIGLYLLAKADSSDAVGSARQDWIERRSDSDERGW